VPRLIAWEVTRRCPLACRHCRADARAGPAEGELTTDEGRRLLEAIAAMAKPTIILTGGEPLERKDVFDLARHARGLGLGVALASCGLPINDETARAAAEAGIEAISISLDGATAASHDAFRGAAGAFEAARRGIEAIKRAGIPFQINTTVARHNAAELPAILEMAARLGAVTFNPFLLVPTGRGRALADQELSAEEYERTLRWLADEAVPKSGPIPGRRDIKIRVTCAPHYQRIRLSRPEPVSHLKDGGSPDPPSSKKREKSRWVRRPTAPKEVVKPVLAAGEPEERGGCLGGKAFAFISHRGIVQICGFLDVACGDLRKANFDFRRIWETSEVFRAVRDVDGYGGKCGRCEYRAACGGCRARAYAVTGDYLAEEPFCAYRPQGESRPG
jgi:radical SAM protein with 4Fe4S-binding SPASM domain